MSNGKMKEKKPKKGEAKPKITHDYRTSQDKKKKPKSKYPKTKHSGKRIWDVPIQDLPKEHIERQMRRHHKAATSIAKTGEEVVKGTKEWIDKQKQKSWKELGIEAAVAPLRAGEKAYKWHKKVLGFKKGGKIKNRHSNGLNQYD